MSTVLTARQLTAPLGAAFALGAVSTAGDWIWARWINDGAVLPGVIHGLLFFVALALVLGWGAGSRTVTTRLLWTLPPTGLVLAAAFYPLAYVLGYLGALLVTWAGMWLALALLLRRARGGAEPVRQVLVRGITAAVGSGLAFWAVSGMWTRPAAETGYGERFIYWTVAFLPGMVALLSGKARKRSNPEVASR